MVRMTIWILALLLLAAGAGMGIRQGAIRVLVSFVGIIISALLAWPLAGPVRFVIAHIGFHNPIVVWMLPPFLTFLILLAIFKSFGMFLHHKVNVYYKYRTNDMELILWERVNKRLGLCLGPLNGLVYFILVCGVIYSFSYWTVQVATSSQESFTIRLLNRMGDDLQGTGFIRAARAVSPLPEIYFKAADLAGLLYQNPRLRDRLSAYPAFLSLSERDDFKQLGQNADFQSAWKSQAPIGKLLDNPQAKAIWSDWSKSEAIWNLVLTNFDDLTNYLQTGRSVKYESEPILGRWDFNVMASLTAMIQTQTNVPSSTMAATRALWSAGYAHTMFVAGADGQAFLKSLPHFETRPNQTPPFATNTWTGTWTADGSLYNISLHNGSSQRSGTAAINNARLTFKSDSDTWVFDKQ